MKIALLVTLMLCTTALAEEVWSLIEKLLKRWLPRWPDFCVDVMFLDSSSQGKVNFRRGRTGVQFMNLMVDYWTAKGITGLTDGTRSGFIQFSSKQKTVIKIHLSDFKNVADLNREIGKQTYNPGHGERATFDAFKLAGKEFFAFNPNPGSEKRILLVTDGNMYPKGNNLVMLVDGLKRRGVEICIVTVGTKVNLGLYERLASKYYLRKGGKKVPCVVQARSWLGFKIATRKALRRLKKS